MSSAANAAPRGVGAYGASNGAGGIGNGRVGSAGAGVNGGAGGGHQPRGGANLAKPARGLGSGNVHGSAGNAKAPAVEEAEAIGGSARGGGAPSEQKPPARLVCSVFPPERDYAFFLFFFSIC